jgi:hypothetical protein
MKMNYKKLISAFKEIKEKIEKTYENPPSGYDIINTIHFLLYLFLTPIKEEDGTPLISGPSNIRNLAVYEYLSSNKFRTNFLINREIRFINVSMWNPEKPLERWFYSAVCDPRSDAQKYLKIWKIYFDHTKKLLSQQLYTINEFISKKANIKKDVEICFPKASKCKKCKPNSVQEECAFVEEGVIDALYPSELVEKIKNILQENNSIDENMLNELFEEMCKRREKFLSSGPNNTLENFCEFLKGRFNLLPQDLTPEESLVIIQYLGLWHKFFNVNHWYGFTYYLPFFEEKERGRFTSCILAMGTSQKLPDEIKILISSITDTLFLYPISRLLPQYLRGIEKDWCKILGEAFKYGGLEYVTHAMGEGKYTYKGEEIKEEDVGIDDALIKIKELRDSLPEPNLLEYLQLGDLERILQNYKNGSLKGRENLSKQLQEIRNNLRIDISETPPPGGHSLTNILKDIFGNSPIEFEKPDSSYTIFIPYKLIIDCLGNKEENGSFVHDIYRYSGGKIRIQVEIRTFPEEYSQPILFLKNEEKKLKKVVIRISYKSNSLPNSQTKEPKSWRNLKLLTYFGDIYAIIKDGKNVKKYDLRECTELSSFSLRDLDGNDILDESFLINEENVQYVFIFTCAPPRTPQKEGERGVI